MRTYICEKKGINLRSFHIQYTNMNYAYNFCIEHANLLSSYKCIDQLLENSRKFMKEYE